jgi:hypothetical protein
MRCPCCGEEVPEFDKHWRKAHQKDYGYGIVVARWVWNIR